MYPQWLKHLRILKLVFAITTLIGSLTVVPSMAAVTYYSKTYGGSKTEEGWSIVQTNDRGCAVTGYTKSFGAGGDDAWVLKLDDAGNVQWQRSYGGSVNDYGELIIEKTGGGYMLAGSTNSYGAGLFDVWVVSIAADGAVEWQKSYGGPLDDVAVSVQSTVDGGFVVAGETRSFGAGDWDVWIIKLSADGGLQWQKTYGGSGCETTSADPIQQTSDGGFIVAGRTNSYGAGDFDLWVLKLDGSGAIQWQKTYGGAKEELARAVRQTSDGSYVVVGYTESFGAGDFDIWVLKLQPNGIPTWQKTFGNSYLDRAFSVWDTPDGGCILAGFTRLNATDRDGLLIKLAVGGAVQWQRAIGESQGEAACAVRPSADGGYGVAGLKQRPQGDWDFWILKMDAQGLIPECPLVRTAYAMVHNTSTGGADSQAVSLNSQATVTSTYASSQQTFATAETQCSHIVECDPPVRINDGSPLYFDTFSEAIEAAADGDTIQAQAVTFREDLILNSDKSLFLDGGYDCFYTSAGNFTEISGSITIEDGTLSVRGISIR